MEPSPLISAVLLQMLRCPQTGSYLRLVPDSQVAELNALMAAGSLQNNLGEALDRPLRGALVNEQTTMIYPIYDHGPTLIVDEAIPASQLAGKLAL